MTKLVFGVGISDADYTVYPNIDGKRALCPYYLTWSNMLQRCYSKTYHVRNPTYLKCSVDEDWLTFSNFKKWMETQDWIGKQLDKDILCAGNKVYSPKTCVFLNKSLNLFLTDRVLSRGEYMLGVYWNNSAKKFKAQCHSGTGKQQYLGLFETELEAHLAWKTYKHRLACKLADEQADLRVAAALRQRYL